MDAGHCPGHAGPGILGKAWVGNTFALTRMGSVVAPICWLTLNGDQAAPTDGVWEAALPAARGARCGGAAPRAREVLLQNHMKLACSDFP